jgi:hypothetical protein
MPDDPFWFVRDQEAFVKRFVLSQVLAPPRSRRRPSPLPKPPAPRTAPPASKKK